MTLASQGPLSQTALGARIGMDPRNLVAVLDFLEQEGLVNRDKDTSDRRRHGVRLTWRGTGMLAKLRRVGAVLEREMLSPLDEFERMTLHRLLMKLLVGVKG
jgi:DNA-binding MarR family transcriptional regulator